MNAIDDENDMQNMTEDYQCDILVDSGTSVNAIDQSLFQQLVYPQTILEKLKAKIYPYGKIILLEL